jgi:uncharacterized protein
VTERLFVDTSAWYAYANRRDPDHRAVREVLESPGLRLITSDFVFDETVTLCRYRLGHDIAAAVGNVLRDGATIDIVRVSADDDRQAWRLFLERPDQRYSFTDCTSFVLMRRLRLGRAVSLDEDFVHEGFEIVP